MTGSMKDLLGDVYASEFPFYQRHSIPSREAAHSIAPRVTELQRKVLDYLSEHKDGATDTQLSEALDLIGSTCRPRRIELVELGLVIDSGRYLRQGKSKRRSTVWVIA